MDVNCYIVLITAFVLDFIFGDPKKLPHLIVLFGNGIGFGEKRLNKGEKRFVKGAILTILLVSLSFLIPFFVVDFFNKNGWSIATISFSIIMLFYCLANRTLVKEGFAVFNVLNEQGLEEGRKRLSWIVGRDTTKLNEQQIRKATFETMAENLSDGVIAPLFFFAFFGVPGAMAYKMINTFDSMIGYKNERYEQFGKFAAKLDDVVNFIPARITAILMLVFTLKFRGISFVFKEGKNHSSPNAGYPEAALAYILNCQFGGPNIYHGKRVEKPYIGKNNRLLAHQEIKRVGNINYGTSSIFVALIIAISIMVKFLFN